MFPNNRVFWGVFYSLLVSLSKVELRNVALCFEFCTCSGRELLDSFPTHAYQTNRVNRNDCPDTPLVNTHSGNCRGTNAKLTFTVVLISTLGVGASQQQGKLI